jgi:hypothetical protein
MKLRAAGIMRREMIRVARTDVKFFAAQIRSPHTRRACARACG